MDSQKISNEKSNEADLKIEIKRVRTRTSVKGGTSRMSGCRFISGMTWVE